MEFIWESISELKTALREAGGELIVHYASARSAIPKLAVQLNANAVFTNGDYEPQAIERDLEVAEALARDGIAFHAFKTR